MVSCRTGSGGLLALALCLSTGLSGADETASGIVRGTFERDLLLTGELEAVRSVSIKAPQTNSFQMRITFMAEEGSLVRPGDPLLDFDNSALAEQVRDLESRILDSKTQIVTRRNELASALKDLEIELAEREFARANAELEAAVDAEVLSRKEYAERQLRFTRTNEELEETRSRIALTERRGKADIEVLEINRQKLEKDLVAASEGVELLSIRAPVEGLVVYERRQGTTLRYQEGDSCWPGQGVVRLPDLSEMQVVFDVSEVDAPSLAIGMGVQVTLDAFPGRELRGVIRSIPSMAVKRRNDSKLAIFRVRAELEETWVGEMKPGMSTLGRVVVERLEDVPLVERNRVRFDGESYWMKEGDGERRIEPIARNARYYVLAEPDGGGAS